MKHKGNTTDYAAERDGTLLKEYRDALARASRIRLADITREVAESPAPRFWVSEERAYAVIRKMEAGESIDGMIAERRRMFRELHRRYREEREKNPRLSPLAVVAKIVNSPAPRHYLTPRTVGELIYRAKKKRRAEEWKA